MTPPPPRPALPQRRPLRKHCVCDPDPLTPAHSSAHTASLFCSTTHTHTPRRPQEERVELKEFLYLPKPNHLVYIKPTVAVVADVASRASVGLKMTIGNNQLERYVVEYYSKRL